MQNYVKTILLLGILSVLFITVGGLVGGRDGILFAFIFSLIVNGSAYFFSDRLALAASGAKPLKKSEAPELYQIIEELTRKMNIPMPKLYIVPTKQANAFATGRDPNHASVAVTEGILDVLSKEELRGVLAHELAHVKNRDILISSIAAVLASSISFIANMGLYGGFGRNNNEENRSAGIVGLLIALLIPIAASIIQLAISRQREFGADEAGAKTIGDGKPLANALLAIHASTKKSPMHINPAYSSLYIDNPIGGVGGTLLNLFSTHPPVDERVKRLLSL
ncbi:MAG: protease [Patescibacteria group bacterium]|nr:MAG: protease [Patescibacteria group bacterium]